MPGDAELVVAARAGDEAAFAAIYDRYADRLHDFCHSVLRDRHEAADAMQDTFVLASQRLGQLREPAKLRSWLFAIARHEALRRARAAGRATPTEDAGTDVAAAGPGPEETVSARDAGTVVWEAAAGLSARDRVLLDLHLRQGLDGQELADAIGTTPGHAYVLMSRLRDQVERSLGAFLVARLGSDECEELQRVLEGWDGTYSPLWRKRVARHVDGCEVCSQTRARFLSPASLLGAAPLVPAVPALRDRVLGRVRETPHAQPAGAWARPGTRDGFPPPMYPDRLRRALLGAAAAVVVVLVAVVALDSFGGDGADVLAQRRERTTSTSTDRKPITTSTAPAPVTTRAAPGGAAPPAPAPPPDVLGPSLTLGQAFDCISNTDPGNTLSASVTDPSGVGAVSLLVQHSAAGTVYSGPMPGGPTSYSYDYQPQVDPTSQTVTWTVTALDGRGNRSQQSRSFAVVPGGNCP